MSHDWFGHMPRYRRAKDQCEKKLEQQKREGDGPVDVSDVLVGVHIDEPGVKQWFEEVLTQIPSPLNSTSTAVEPRSEAMEKYADAPVMRTTTAIWGKRRAPCGLVCRERRHGGRRAKLAQSSPRQQQFLP